MEEGRKAGGGGLTIFADVDVWKNRFWMRRMKGGHTRAASRSWQTGGGMTLIFSSNRTIFKRTLFDEWWIGRTNGRMTKVNHFFLFWWRFYFASAIIPPFYLCVVISPMVWRARPVMNLVPLDHWHNSVLFYFVFSFSFCVLLFIYILLDKRTRIAWEGRERMNGLSLHSSFVSRTLIRQVNSVCVIYDLTGALHWVDWVFFFFFLFSILNVWWLVVGRGGIGIQRTNIEGKGSIIKKLLLVWSRYAERAWSNWRNRKIAGL